LFAVSANDAYQAQAAVAIPNAPPRWNSSVLSSALPRPRSTYAGHSGALGLVVDLDAGGVAVVGVGRLETDREGDVHRHAVVERGAAREVEHVVDVLRTHDALVVGGEVRTGSPCRSPAGNACR
jgi:hypothetical protein